jgi:MFS family permease
VFCWGTSKENRLLPVQYFSHRTLFILFILGILSAVAIFVPVYFISLFFQFAKGDGALKAAGRLAPFLVVLVISCVMQGGIMGKDGRYAPWYIGSSALVIIGSALMYTVDSETSTAKVYGYSIILGFGAGSVIQTGFTVSQAIVPRSEMSLAVAFANLSQLIGIVVALIVANSIFLNVAQNSVGRLLPNATPLMIKSAISGTGSTVVKSLNPELKAKVLDAIIDAISKTYIFVIACSSLEFLFSLLLKWEKVFLNL